MNNKFKKPLSLLFIFMKIGLFTFGGGYAMIPLIQRETVDKKKWIESDEILDIIAIAESTPGPIAINASTFIGYRVSGLLGAFFATIGVVTPSFIIVYAISFILRQFENLSIIKYAFMGIRAGILALIIMALFNLYKQFKKDVVSYIIILFSFLTVAFLKINVLVIIISSAVIGLVGTFIVAHWRKKHDLS